MSRNGKLLQGDPSLCGEQDSIDDLVPIGVIYLVAALSLEQTLRQIVTLIASARRAPPGWTFSKAHPKVDAIRV